MKEKVGSLNDSRMRTTALLSIAALVVFAFEPPLLVSGTISAVATRPVAQIATESWRYISAAVTIVGASYAAGWAIGRAATAGAAAIAERPEVAVWTLLYTALGEGIAIYGLIIAILILTM